MKEAINTCVLILSLAPKALDLILAIENAFGSGNGPAKKEALNAAVKVAVDTHPEPVNKPQAVSAVSGLADTFVAGLNKVGALARAVTK